MDFTLNPLTPHTGAEIVGLTLRDDLPEATRQRIRDAFNERAVLVFRNQQVAPEVFMRSLRSIFGEIMPQMLRRFTIDDEKLIGFVSSDDTDKPGPEGKRLVRGEQYHTDHSNVAEPPLATALCARDLPSEGGDTQFVNVIAAFADLPEATKQKALGKRVLHTYLSSRSPRRKAAVSAEERAKLPETIQPLVIRHQGSGKPALYLNTAHMESVLEMDRDEGFALIDELMQHATQPRYEYRHKWLSGDIVIWDNRAVLHQANGDYGAQEKRFLYRIMIKGDTLQPALAA